MKCAHHPCSSYRSQDSSTIPLELFVLKERKYFSLPAFFSAGKRSLLAVIIYTFVLVGSISQVHSLSISHTSTASFKNMNAANYLRVYSNTRRCSSWNNRLATSNKRRNVFRLTRTCSIENGSETDSRTGMEFSTEQSEFSNKIESKELPKSSLNTNVDANSSHYETLFSLILPEGRCVGLKLNYDPNQPTNSISPIDPIEIQKEDNHWIKQILHPDEVQYGIDLKHDHQRVPFFIGRMAMRTALEQIKDLGIDEDTPAQAEKREDKRCKKFTNTHTTFNTVTNGHIETALPIVSKREESILKDEYGRPRVPKGFMGSISHKKTTGVAIVNTIPNDNETGGNDTLPRIGIGVDIEYRFSKGRSIAKRILTPNEIQDLGKLDGMTDEEEVMLRFSLKESVYKAMHPLICQFVGFQEAEITPRNDGSATVFLDLKSGEHHRFDEVTAHWTRVDDNGEDYFLSASIVTLREGVDECRFVE